MSLESKSLAPCLSALEPWPPRDGQAQIGIVVIGLLASGVIATSGLQSWHSLFGLVCGPACLVMIVEMLISFNMYSGRARHQSPAA